MYVHHRLRKPPCSLAQIPRCTLILSGVHRAFTPRSQHKRREAQTRVFFLPPLSSVPQRLDTPLKRHAASCTSNNRLVKVDSFETSFNDSRVRSTSSSRHAAFSRGDLEALACARGLTANWRKSVLLSCCAKCAGRIVGRYYVPEMLVRSGYIKKIARFYFSFLLAPIVRRRFCSSPEETFLVSQDTVPWILHVHGRTISHGGINQYRAVSVPDSLLVRCLI